MYLYKKKYFRNDNLSCVESSLSRRSLLISKVRFVTTYFRWFIENPFMAPQTRFENRLSIYTCTHLVNINLLTFSKKGSRASNTSDPYFSPTVKISWKTFTQRLIHVRKSTGSVFCVY